MARHQDAGGCPSGKFRVLLLALAGSLACSSSTGGLSTSTSAGSTGGSSTTGGVSSSGGVSTGSTGTGTSGASSTGGTTGQVDAGPFRLPQVPANSGQVYPSERLVQIVAANETEATFINAFGDALMTGDWWTEVGAEYGIGRGSVVHAVGPPIGASFDFSELQSYIAQVIADAGIEPNGETFYLVYIPVGVDYMGISPDLCGAHQTYPLFTSAGDTSGFVRRCPIPFGAQSADEALTQATSHEAFEAASDPLGDSYIALITTAFWDNSPWFSVFGRQAAELADLCTSTAISEPYGDGGFKYQRVWSNAAAALSEDPCIPALSVPYFSLFTAQDWYTGQPGETVTIPVIGWSNAATDNWAVAVTTENGSGGFESLAGQVLTNDFTSALGYAGPPGCEPAPVMNNGVTGSLQIKVPAVARPDDFILFAFQSSHVSPTCGYLLSEDEDFFHLAPVGLYVPEPSVGTWCDPSGTDVICAPVGLSCHSSRLGDGGTPASCQLPGELQACQSRVGCVEGYTCKAGILGGPVCIEPCQSTTDCIDPITICSAQALSTTQGGCVPNPCGPGSLPDGGSNGTAIYQLCNSEATNDGTCYPNGPPLDGGLVCQQGGATAEYQPCGDKRADGGTGALCEAGSECAFIILPTSSPSACYPACSIGPPDSGPICATGSVCMGLGDGSLGVCVPTCTMSCPPPLVCVSDGLAGMLCEPM